MSIEDVARAASADLRARTSTDSDAGLDAVLSTHSRRRRQMRGTIALAAVATVAAAWWGGATFGGHATGPEPAPAPSPTGPPAPDVCADDMVTCLGDRTYRFALDSPVKWQIPRGYGVGSGQGVTSRMVESYSHTGAFGVTMLEGVRAASPGDVAVVGVPATPSGFVHWLAARPYLNSSAVSRTTFDGRLAWHVRVAVKPHRGSGPGQCAGVGFRCHPITYQDSGAVTGIWSDMTADYTAFRLPNTGTALVWSWAFGHDTGHLDRNRSLAAGIKLVR